MRWSLFWLLLALVSSSSCSLDRKPLSAAERAAKRAEGGAGSSSAGGVSGNIGASGANGNIGAAGVGGTGSAGVGASGVGGAAGVGVIDACGGCDDGVFCNGAEHCMVGDPSADARGCVSLPACLAGQTCDEATRACDTHCAANGGDADGDGHQAMSCGGDDCNDANALIYPGATELCDGYDEDCNGKVDDGIAQLTCLSSNAISSCTLGQCVITVCSTGYADCDKLASDGCETPLDYVAGDCRTSDCTGADIVDDTDTPPDDGDPCTIESCKNGTPTVKNAMDGTKCGAKKNSGTCMSGQCM